MKLLYYNPNLSITLHKELPAPKHNSVTRGGKRLNLIG